MFIKMIILRKNNNKNNNNIHKNDLMRILRNNSNNFH